MVAFNWGWMAVVTPAAGPIIATIFPGGPGGPDDHILHGSFDDDAGNWHWARWFGLPWFWAVLLVCLVLDDVCFYCYHRALHAWPELYKNYHKPHHQFKAPFSWSSHAVHPVEMSLQSIGALLGPVLFGFTLGQLWCWLAVRQLQGVLDHTGYSIDPIAWLPGVGGTKFHDDHHKYLTGNYASCFSFIDRLAGTAYKKKKP